MMSFSLYIAALAVTDTIGLLIGETTSERILKIYLENKESVHLVSKLTPHILDLCLASALGFEVRSRYPHKRTCGQ